MVKYKRGSVMWGTGTFCYSLLNTVLEQEILVRNFCDLVSSLHNALNGECRTRIRWHPCQSSLVAQVLEIAEFAHELILCSSE